jgi:hypothetical protein
MRYAQNEKCIPFIRVVEYPTSRAKYYFRLGVGLMTILKLTAQNWAVVM